MNTMETAFVGLEGQEWQNSIHDFGTPARKGPVIGFLGGQKIYGWLHDRAERRFEYAGVAPRLASGNLDLLALRPGEFVYRGKLVYARYPRASCRQAPLESAAAE